MSDLRTTLRIHGLACGGGGALTVERAISRVPGIVEVYVNPATREAYVRYEPTTAALEELIPAVESVGFTAEFTDRRAPAPEKRGRPGHSHALST